ncbi:unnamed protein product [Brugia pahangi]|uniref:Uncharacterized protein n=1 Tax=Brugia pahangi TaxID=6280 RepID=A0A0N4TSW1_BRUPA|nr:unnamed protein product [Brugia pahangi]
MIVYEDGIDSCKGTQNERMTNKRSCITATTKTILPQAAIEAAAAHHTIFAPITAATIEIKICFDNFRIDEFEESSIHALLLSHKKKKWVH